MRQRTGNFRYDCPYLQGCSMPVSENQFERVEVRDRGALKIRRYSIARVAGQNRYSDTVLDEIENIVRGRNLFNDVRLEASLGTLFEQPSTLCGMCPFRARDNQGIRSQVGQCNVSSTVGGLGTREDSVQLLGTKRDLDQIIPVERCEGYAYVKQTIRDGFECLRGARRSEFEMECRKPAFLNRSHLAA